MRDRTKDFGWRWPSPGKRERGRTLLTIDKQSGARADDGGVANDTAAAVDSISIPLGGGGGGGKEQRTGSSSTNCPLPRLGPILELTHPRTHRSSKRDRAVNMVWGGWPIGIKEKRKKGAIL
jgi:hypothetical protein